MKKLSAIGIFAFLLSPYSAFAQTSAFSYDYLELGFSNGDIKIGTSKFDVQGAGIGFSNTIADKVFLTGTFNTGDVKFQGFKADVTNTSLGLGGYAPIAPSTDLVGEFSLVNSRVKALGTSESDSGYDLSFGIRHAATNSIEVFGFLSTTEIDNERTNATAAGIRFKVNPKTSLALSYNTTDNNDADGTSITLSLRTEF